MCVNPFPSRRILYVIFIVRTGSSLWYGRTVQPKSDRRNGMKNTLKIITRNFRARSNVTGGHESGGFVFDLTSLCTMRALKNKKTPFE